MSNQIKPVSELVIDLMRIRAASKDIESILDAALSNASGNPEFDSVSRRVRGFREAVLCLPESVHPDTELLDGLERLVIQSEVDVIERMGEFTIYADRQHDGETLREAIAGAIQEAKK